MDDWIMSAAARDVLRQLFFKGPTWDGDISSKVGRGELVRLGYAFRENGWQSLTQEGRRPMHYQRH